MMKKLYYILIAFATLLTSCVNGIDNQEDTHSNSDACFSASISNSIGVRTSISYPDGRTGKITWNANDRIAINTIAFETETGSDVNSTTTGSPATFSTTGGFPIAPYYAFYPASIASSQNRCTLPKTFTFNGSNNADYLPMYAYSTSNRLDFHNICGVLQLTLPDGLTVNSISVTANQRINGAFQVIGNKAVQYQAAGTGALTPDQMTNTLNCPDGTISTGNKFLIPIPENTYNSLTITINHSNGTLTRTKNNVTINANEIKPITFTDLFYIESLTDGDKIKLTRQINAHTDGLSLQYSTDGTTWHSFYNIAKGATRATDSTIISTTAGTRYYFRATTTNSRFGYTRATENKSFCVYQFSIAGNARIGGNIMYLLDNDGSTPMPEGAFPYLFEKSFNITDASALILPNDTAPLCYTCMFTYCRALQNAPALPAMTASDYCYQTMFYDCNLSAAPALPATTLGTNCYSGMFEHCDNLTSIPNELPATSLADSCYYRMFAKCINLTAAPALPATTLANSCYSGMFYHCISLTAAPTLSSTSLATNCYSGMLKNCISLSAAPALPATTLAEGCYANMLDSCTVLTTAPELSAETLTVKCYYEMFKNCKQLVNVTMLATDVNATDCLTDWLNNAGTDTESPKLTISDNITTIDNGSGGKIAENTPSRWLIFNNVFQTLVYGKNSN